jgi:hypothetical protein
MDSQSDNREKIWLILADLYLDSPVEHDFLARQLAVIPVSVGEMERILFEEVHLALYTNLTDVAGQWGAWDSDFVIKTIQKMLEHDLQYPFRRKLRRFQTDWIYGGLKKSIMKDWQVIVSKLEKLRSNDL